METKRRLPPVYRPYLTTSGAINWTDRTEQRDSPPADFQRFATAADWPTLKAQIDSALTGRKTWKK